MTVIIDYGMGNLRSVVKILERMSVPVKVITTGDSSAYADKIILPGVGHFSRGVEELEQRNFLNYIKKKVIENKIPILGICLGMQLMFTDSEEGDGIGLGLIKGEVRKFNIMENSIKIPHMGWNTITHNGNKLFKGIEQGSEFYFAHSYYVEPADDPIICASSEYGFKFCAALSSENIYATQFHPEKSFENGARVIKNFIRFC
ncbi:MAG: imidazole glycerol phosphate synthase subunit HisH [Saprospiraceae bacterium]|nr:imidazole glycerol phosphate synthase subunit HisH [Saprospiraceae bacterium]